MVENDRIDWSKTKVVYAIVAIHTIGRGKEKRTMFEILESAKTRAELLGAKDE